MAQVDHEIRAVWESMTDAFFAVDDEWRFTYINTQGERFLQRPRAELLGKNLWEEFPDAIHSEVYELYHKAIREQTAVKFEQFSNRLHAWFEIHAYPYEGGLAVYFRDISDRKTALESERQARQFLQSVLDAVFAGIAVLDDSGTVIAVNQAWKNLAVSTRDCGLSCEVGSNFLRACEHGDGHTPESAQLAGAIREIIAGERRDFELECLCPNIGGISWFKVRLGRFDDETPVRVVVSYEDISERKSAEVALRSSEERLRQMAETIQEVFWLSDPVNRVFLYVSPAYERIWGRTCQSLYEQPHSYLDSVHPEDRERVRAAHSMENVIRGYDAVYRIIRPDGSVRWIWDRGFPIANEAGQVYRVTGIAQDITEQKRAEDALRLSEATLTEAQNTAHLGYMELDVASGVRYWSDEAYRILGVEPQSEQPTTQRFLDHVHPDDLERVTGTLNDFLNSGQPFCIEHRIVRLSGEVRWVQAQGEAIHNAQGRLERYVSTMWDITARKLSEIEVLKGQQRFAAIVNSALDAIVIMDSAGRIVEFNPAAEQVFGYKREEVIGRDLSQTIIPARFRNEHKAAMARYLSTGEARILNHRLELSGLRAHGTEFPLELSVTHIVLESESMFVGFIRDITEQKRIEAEQAELRSQVEYQHQRLVEFLQHVPGIVWENRIDPETGEQTSVFVNDYVREVLGYEPEEWLSTPNFWWNVVHPDDRAGISHHVETSWEGRLGDAVTFRMTAKDGHEVWVESQSVVILNEQGQVTGLRGVTMDITQRIRAQEVQSRLAAMLESTVDLVGWMDTEGRAQYLNPAGRAMLGIGPDEPLDELNWAEFRPEWAWDLLVSETLPKAREYGTWAGETAFLSRDGRQIPIAQVTTAHKDAAGNVLFYSTVARDISERKAAMTAMQRYSAELEQRVEERTKALESSNHALQEQVAERQMAMGALQEVAAALRQAKEEADQANLAKSEFLSRMSHELRTPLNAILGFGQILSMDTSIAPRRQESIQHILKAGQHLLHLINEVLDISRIEAGNLSLSAEPVPVHLVVEEVLDLMRPIASNTGITLRSVPGPEMSAFLLADRQRLKQVLLNLVSNGVKYNRADGSVSISAAIMPETGQVRVSVEDTGPGLPEEDLKKLFTPFERLSASRTTIEGTGIGLALSKRLMEAMKGAIGVESVAGQGSTFWIELPQAENPVDGALGQMSAGKEKAPGAEQPTPPLHTVLYIEDNLPNLELIEMLLQERMEVRLLTAMQGSTGLDMAIEHSPDIILLDLHLPDMNGDEVLRRLRSNPQTAEIPVIVISADATSRQIERLKAAGANAYLTKPLNVVQFLSVLEENLKQVPATVETA